ncbi:MAG: XTP/dITP diphosphatase [Desulfobacterales bacterium]|nr:XTP/dITP diphosphatase [Desulfobacterales bacterium]MCP4162458.1 XTP/dITP diphosphatase [Deltaproteobacteria bacterium]
MNPKLIIVIATRNHNKTKEIREYFKNSDIEFKDLNDFGPIPEVVEDGDTFEANAYKKASFTARVLGFPAMADDSGLCVEALDGAPGVFSARFAGEDATDKERTEKILKELEGNENRNAYFECVISLAVPTGPALTYEGKCEGLITKKPKGENGFGYDPVFFYPEFDKTFAEASIEEKSGVSHRGKALKDLNKEIDKVKTWITQNMPRTEKFDCGG